VSRTVLWGAGGVVPLVYPTTKSVVQEIQEGMIIYASILEGILSLTVFSHRRLLKQND
jgi:hypothetical protein